MILYLARHGETDMNKKGVYYGWMDCGLNDQGLVQAQYLQHVLADKKIKKVFTSTLKRAYQTAEQVIKGNPVVLEKDQRIKEFNFGIFEGMHYTKIAVEEPEVWRRWNEDWRHTKIPQGESFQEYYDRIKEFMQEKILNDQQETALIVAHQGVLRVMMSILLQMPQEGYWNFHFEHGCYSKVEIMEGFSVLKNLNYR